MSSTTYALALTTLTYSLFVNGLFECDAGIRRPLIDILKRVSASGLQNDGQECQEQGFSLIFSIFLLALVFFGFLRCYVFKIAQPA